jgi:hypothetical protein
MLHTERRTEAEDEEGDRWFREVLRQIGATLRFDRPEHFVK